MRNLYIAFFVSSMLFSKFATAKDQINEANTGPTKKQENYSLRTKLSEDAQCALGKEVTSQGLYFVENRGQITDQQGRPRTDIQYKLDGGAVTVYAGNGALHYQWLAGPVPDGSHAAPSAGVPGGEEYQAPSIQDARIYRMDVVLRGANKQAKVIAEDEQEYYERYYTGNGHNEGEGIVAHTFKKIRYEEVYPHIDWVLYVRDGKMEYDFVVRPGGRVSDIQLEYKGATGLQQEADGSVRSSNPMGSIREQRPVSYEQETGRPVASCFRLRGHKLSFETDGYTGTLVIDPQLIWATYYGDNSFSSSDMNGGTALYDFTRRINVVHGADGNVYMAGHTNSSTNIATSGAYENTIDLTGTDCFLAAFSPSGSLLWGTYFNNFIYQGLAYDPTGNLYLAGYNGYGSTNIATPGAYQATLNGISDAVLAKFSTGGALQWCTYYGGEDWEDAAGISCDAAGNAYLCGATQSQTGIASTGAYQTTEAGNDDAFLAKFSGSGSLLWATYFGGESDDAGLAASCDAGGSVFIGGIARSATGIASSMGVYQPALSAPMPWGSVDGFLAKFDANGMLQWSTYYGGNGAENITALSCDATGNACIAGWTNSTDGSMASPGAYQQSLSGGNDAFIAKFDGNGNRVWGSYYGGTNYEGVYGITSNIRGDIYICGATNSSDHIASGNAPMSSPGGMTDGFWVKFSPSGSRVLGSYFGGPGVDYAWSIACADSNSVYLAGYTASTSGIATPGAQQGSFATANSAFLAHYGADSLYLSKPFPDTLLCQGDTFRVAYYTDIDFASGNVFTAQLSDANGSFSNATVIGTLNAVRTDSIFCRLPQNIATGSHYRIRVISGQPRDTVVDNKDITIKGSPQLSSISSNSPVCSGDSLGFSIVTGGSYSYQWAGPNSYSSNVKNARRTNIGVTDSGSYIVKITGSNSCSINDTVRVMVKQTPASVTAGSNSPVCAGGSLNLSGSSSTAGVSYSWSGPGGYSSGVQNPTVNNATTGQSGSYTVTATLNGCHSSAATTVTVNALSAAPAVAVSASPGTEICATQTVTFTATVSNGAAALHTSGERMVWT